jgi:hypothetical protein
LRDRTSLRMTVAFETHFYESRTLIPATPKPGH